MKIQKKKLNIEQDTASRTDLFDWLMFLNMNEFIKKAPTHIIKLLIKEAENLEKENEE